MDGCGLSSAKLMTKEKPRCSHSHRAPLNQVRLLPHCVCASGAACVIMLHGAEAHLLACQMCSSLQEAAPHLHPPVSRFRHYQKCLLHVP